MTSIDNHGGTLAPLGTGEFTVRELTPEDKPWAQGVLRRYWASLVQVSRGRLMQADRKSVV